MFRKILMVVLGSFIGFLLAISSGKNNSYGNVYYKELPTIAEKDFDDVVIERQRADVEEYDFAKKEFVSMGVFKVTAYCSCEKCCGKWARVRDSGYVYGAGMEELIPGKSIAIDASVASFGDKLYFNGSEYTVSDRGVSGNTIDLYTENHEKAVKWGVKYFEVFYER